MDSRSLFDRFYRGNDFSFGGRPSYELQQYLDRCPRTGSALDLGCGDGRNALFLARKGFHVTAVDVSRTGLGKLARFADQAKLSQRLVTVALDVREFTLRPETFDLVLTVTILDHLPGCGVTPLFSRIASAMRDQSLFYAKVHTVNDPGFSGNSREASPLREAIQHYFEAFDLYDLVGGALDVVGYAEHSENDFSHGPRHRHSFAKGLAIRRTTVSSLSA